MKKFNEFINEDFDGMLKHAKGGNVPKQKMIDGFDYNFIPEFFLELMDSDINKYRDKIQKEFQKVFSDKFTIKQILKSGKGIEITLKTPDGIYELIIGTSTFKKVK